MGAVRQIKSNQGKSNQVNSASIENLEARALEKGLAKHLVAQPCRGDPGLIVALSYVRRRR
jgi:hypothetical protein